MSENLRDVLADFVDREAHATQAPTDPETEVRQVRRVVARRRAVRATAVSALTATVILGVAAGAMSLASRAPELPPALSSTDAPPTMTPTPTTSPTRSATQEPSATPTEATAPTQDVTEPPATEPAVPPSVVRLATGTDGVTITDRLRLRSRPEVSAAATELGSLPTGTTFHVVEGPVLGSGYWWYHVADLPASVGAQQGWIAAADLDGTPWIAAAPSSSCADAGFDVSAPTATSLADLQAGVTGTWVGCVITPWVSPYEVTIAFRADGTYSSTALTKPDGIAEPALYDGLDGDAPGKTYALKDLLDDSTGVGQIDVVFDTGSVVRGDLRNVRLMGDRLEFEFFHRGTYGPLVYQLTRTGPATTS